jgi:hypothetical protein
LEVGFLTRGFFVTLFPPLIELVDGLDTLCDAKLDCLKWFAAGFETQAAFGRIQSLGEFVQG